jgi:hypothetical protein
MSYEIIISSSIPLLNLLKSVIDNYVEFSIPSSKTNMLRHRSLKREMYHKNCSKQIVSVNWKVYKLLNLCYFVGDKICPRRIFGPKRGGG